MKNLGSGMDGILKMILGVLVICGSLIMVVSNIDLNGSGNDGQIRPASTMPALDTNQAPAAIEAPPAAPAQPAAPLPGTTAQSAMPAVPGTSNFSPTGRKFGDPMMDPNPIGLDGRPMASPDAAPAPTPNQDAGQAQTQPQPQPQPMAPPQDGNQSAPQTAPQPEV